MTELKAYLEEYTTKNGVACRIRDKNDNKKIVLLSSSYNSKLNLLMFMSKCKMIDEKLYDKNNTDTYLIIHVNKIIDDLIDKEISANSIDIILNNEIYAIWDINSNTFEYKKEH